MNQIPGLTVSEREIFYCISSDDQFLVKEILDSTKLEFSGIERRDATCIQFYCISEGLLQRAFVRGAFLSGRFDQ